MSARSHVRRAAGIFGALALVLVALVLVFHMPAGSDAAAVGGVAALGAGKLSGLVGFAGLLSPTLTLPPPLDVASLDRARIAPADGYEVTEDVLYDTVDYAAAGNATMNFFTTQSNDRTITNLAQPGQLPKPDWFHAKRLFLIPLLEAITAADYTAGRPRDLDRILKTARGVFSLTPSTTGRPRGPIPLDMLGGIGGGQVTAAGTGAVGATATLLQVKNAEHGGYPFDLIIGPSEQFAAKIEFGNVLAVSAIVPLRVLLWGWRYKKAG